MLTSASASTQTTILPTARTTLSMARWKAGPGGVRPRSPTLPDPDLLDPVDGRVVDRLDGGAAGLQPNQNVLGDTVSALGFAICFYYGFTGLACAFYFRRELFKSARNFIFAGLIPLVGGLRGDQGVRLLQHSGNNYSKALLGIQTPILVGIGGLILGVILMFAAWPFFPQFFRRRPFEAADPAVLRKPPGLSRASLSACPPRHRRAFLAPEPPSTPKSEAPAGSDRGAL